MFPNVGGRIGPTHHETAIGVGPLQRARQRLVLSEDRSFARRGHFRFLVALPDEYLPELSVGPPIDELPGLLHLGPVSRTVGWLSVPPQATTSSHPARMHSTIASQSATATVSRLIPMHSWPAEVTSATLTAAPDGGANA